jgi:hypothetical protein
MAEKKKADPMRTRTGKPRLGPLNIAQLTDMLGKCRAKDKNKISMRIKFLEKISKKSPEKALTETVEAV